MRGYTLIARLVGEELRRSNCLVSDAQAMLRKTRGDASALLIHWINGYLGIFERGKPIPNRIKALAEVLAVREPFKADLSPGDYIVTPLLVKRLVEWASNGSMGGLSDEKANWLAVRHEDLLEDAITRIVKTAMGEEADGSEYLKQALEPWSKYGRLKGKVNDIEDAVEYINERYGKELGEEFKNISSDCWNAIVLALGTAWADYPLRAIIENIKKPGGDVTDLMPIVNSAIQYITNPNLENNGNASCDAVRLLIINNEIPPLTKGLLYTLLVLDTLAEGKIDYIRNALNEFIKEIEDVRRRNRGLYFIEVIYVHGLAVLTVHAVKRAIREYMSDDELKARALETAGWAIWSIGDPSLIIAVVNLMSSLSNSSLNDWAVILAAATSALIDNENELSELSEFIDDLWAKRNGLSDWGGKAYLINAMVDTLRTKENAEQICEIFKKEILNAINGIGSDPLRVLSKAHAYSRLAIFEVDCGISLEQEIVKLIKTLENADQAAWLRDEQFVEYLRHYSLEKPEDALRRLINEYLSGLYHAMGKLSVDNADLDNALKYFEKAMNINKGFGLWFNYIVSYNTLVRARVLKAGNINEFIDVSREFGGDVFNEALKRFSPTVAGLTVLASSLLAEYLVYLAIVGDKARFTELMRSRDWLLQYLPPDVKTVTVLLLKWLGADVEVPNAEELINAMMIDLNPEFLPALRRVLGIGVDCGEECGELGNPNDVEMCNTACAAAGGNKYALKKLMEYVRREFKPLTSALANFSPRAIVQALALMHTLGMLALILNALLSKDYESAKAIVTVSEYLLSKSIGKELFGDLRRAIDEGGDVDGIKLALAKLYYLWI
ncbi:hypothetical protein [Vulcanisaeta distributa]|uniref:hypothetical protein n=1 Tax=Vulcanisaeta distributa TaxID=164451 RepID=UPI0006D07420|nr:hypothetical protein [Vulcanisaeta distributa]